MMMTMANRMNWIDPTLTHTHTHKSIWWNLWNLNVDEAATAAQNDNYNNNKQFHNDDDGSIQFNIIDTHTQNE